MKITDEMENWFYQRTNFHLKLVEQYIRKLIKLFPEYNELIDHVAKHDQSKFKEPELIPYIILTWNYKCQHDNVQFDLSGEMKTQLNNATIVHILTNPHHVEYWDNNFTIDKFNSTNRDAIPENMVDGTNMPNIYIAEMVCDWCAVSNERKSHPKDWADMNINKRWKFTDKQIQLIYDLIDKIF